MCMADGYAEFCAVRERRAAKEHRCEECGRTIPVGERYSYASGKFEGDFFDAKQCVHCAAAAGWLLKECHGFLYGGVLEDLEEHRYNGYPFAKTMGLMRLIVGIRRDWKRFDGRGLMAVPKVAA